ncbi:MAG: SDR family NAD(P)-dependent oxidoreductase, partial [Sciscionella sp.]
MRVAGRVAIVTGGGGGIGAGLVARLAAEGASVLIADSDSAAAETAASAVNAACPGASIAAEADVTD